MKQTRSLFTVFLFISQAYSIAGFGLHLDQSYYNVSESISPLLVENLAGGDSLKVGSFTQHRFKNGFGLGGYLYIDAIPVVDIDIEGNILFSTYDFSFRNNVYTIDKTKLYWLAGSGYLTVKKKLFNLKIPLLANAKLSMGAGINFHSSIPKISQDMLESVIGVDNLETGELDEEKLIIYLNENKVPASGFHIQSGLQLKLLFLDTFLYYRQVFAKDVIPGGNGFGSLNLRLGIGL